MSGRRIAEAIVPVVVLGTLAWLVVAILHACTT